MYTLHYFLDVDIIEKILEDVSYYSLWPDMKDEDCLVLAIIYDYIMRNYQKRAQLPNDRELPQPSLTYILTNSGRVILCPSGTEVFLAVEESIHGMRVQIAASVARIRVRQQVGSLRLLLPEEWRQAELYSEEMPFYGWYNQLVGKQDIVTGWLNNMGFRRVVIGKTPSPMEYCSDKHCPDSFVFNSADRQMIFESEIVDQKNLDKSNCFALHCTLAMAGGGEEIMFVNTTNLLSAIHMEGLLGNKFPMVLPVPTIRIIRTIREDEDNKLATKMGSKVTRASSEEFYLVEPGNEKNRQIRHIFLEATDNRSGVINPIDYLEAESDDINILRDMWLLPGNPAKEARNLEMNIKTTNLLKHALKFNNVRSITFLSHHKNLEDVESLVLKVLEAQNKALIKETELISVKQPTTVPAFGLTVPLMPALQEEREALEAGQPSVITDSKMVHFPAGPNNNAFTVCCIVKEVGGISIIYQFK
ncbi:unnamed protein product [Protopolystoma xenopodis]|uniref:Uncharacterized protein n=1 Tax=Protopolystoma xenopodis TaxID=117903 RepID=A0A3S5CMK6_9PLAT|nr:unnamed protein product [Protopolystoma xenopodis]